MSPSHQATGAQGGGAKIRPRTESQKAKGPVARVGGDGAWSPSGRATGPGRPPPGRQGLICAKFWPSPHL